MRDPGNEVGLFAPFISQKALLSSTFTAAAYVANGSYISENQLQR